MSSGKTHDYLNMTAGALLAGVMIGASWPAIVITPFVAGWLVATLIFSPDADVMPKKRTKILRLILYPYSIIFKHRGLSHSLLFGTITRIFYAVVVFGLFVFVLSKMGYIDFGTHNYLAYLGHFVVNYNYDLVAYKAVTWLYLGMFGADLLHLLLDRLSTIGRRFTAFFR